MSKSKKSKPSPVFYIVADHIDCRRVFHSIKAATDWLRDMYDGDEAPYVRIVLEDLEIE